MKRLRLKALSVGLVIALLSGLVWVNYLQHKTNEAKLELEIKQSQLKLNELEVKSVESKTKADQLLREKQELEKQLQSKKEEAKKIAEAKVQVTQVAIATGNCDTWIAEAGITEVASAKELIRRESNCNPNAVNSSSGACGIAQELPCGKSGCQLGDGACQVKWMKSYVYARYGSFRNAVAWHNSKNWY